MRATILISRILIKVKMAWLIGSCCYRFASTSILGQGSQWLLSAPSHAVYIPVVNIQMFLYMYIFGNRSLSGFHEDGVRMSSCATYFYLVRASGCTRSIYRVASEPERGQVQDAGRRGDPGSLASLASISTG